MKITRWGMVICMLMSLVTTPAWNVFAEADNPKERNQRRGLDSIPSADLENYDTTESSSGSGIESSGQDNIVACGICPIHFSTLQNPSGNGFSCLLDTSLFSTAVCPSRGRTWNGPWFFGHSFRCSTSAHKTSGNFPRIAIFTPQEIIGLVKTAQTSCPTGYSYDSHSLSSNMYGEQVFNAFCKINGTQGRLSAATFCGDPACRERLVDNGAPHDEQFWREIQYCN